MKPFASTLFLTLLLGSAALGENDVKPVPGGETAELLKILKDTQSRDTFLLTLDTLVKLEPKRDGLLPTVIRRADKLGLLKGMSSGKLTAEQEALSSAMNKILEARTSQELSNTASGALLGAGSGTSIVGRGQGAVIGAAGGGIVGRESDASHEKKRKFDVKSVYIPIFENKTFQATPYRGMEFELTRAVIREIEAKGYKIINDPNLR